MACFVVIITYEMAEREVHPHIEILGMILIAAFYALGICAVFTLASVVVGLLPWAVAMLIWGPLHFAWFAGGGAVVNVAIIGTILG
jgi:hypothetical protein